MATYNNIHRQQLFHWIGRHIDEQADHRRLTDALRKQYVNSLSGALRNGLWVKTPKDPDYLGDGSLIKVHRPIACFTEWSLGQSLPHTTRYGRLGLGFSKKFVLSRGGQPVIYVRDSTKNDPYTTALKTLARFFKSGDAKSRIPRHRLEALRQQFDYLSHFTKRIKRPVVPRVLPEMKLKPETKIVGKKSPLKIDPFIRSFGPTLHFLEEREWRIVHDSTLDDFFSEGPGAPGPQYYLPVKPGRELFTVVLPDNHTVSMAMDNTQIRNKLFPKDGPHVTIMSLQDVGTF